MIKYIVIGGLWGIIAGSIANIYTISLSWPIIALIGVSFIGGSVQGFLSGREFEQDMRNARS